MVVSLEEVVVVELDEVVSPEEVDEVEVVESGEVLDGGLDVLVAYGPTGSLNCIRNRP